MILPLSFSPQATSLHQELHPHASVCVLHATSSQYFCQRCRSLLWIHLGEYGKGNSRRAKVHHRSSASQQNPVRKYKIKQSCAPCASPVRTVSIHNAQFQKILCITQLILTSFPKLLTYLCVCICACLLFLKTVSGSKLLRLFNN